MTHCGRSYWTNAQQVVEQICYQQYLPLNIFLQRLFMPLYGAESRRATRHACPGMSSCLPFVAILFVSAMPYHSPDVLLL